MQNFQGATVDDMQHHVIPLIHTEPSFIIMHAGANDAPYSASRKTLDNFITSKSFITDNFPNCNVIVSTPTLSINDGKAALSQTPS